MHKFHKYFIATAVFATTLATFSLAILGSATANANFKFGSHTAHADPFASQATYTIYVGDGCPHCANVEAYVEKNDLTKIFPIVFKEVYNNRENAKEFNEVADKIGAPLNKRGVPFMVYGKEYWIGDTPIISVLDDKYEIWKLNKDTQSTVSNPNENNDNNPDVSTDPSKDSSANSSKNAVKEAGVTIPILIGAALVDSVNPCEFAILIILLSTIMANSNKRRALYAGLAFAAAIFISYFAMGLGLYKAIATVGVSTLFMTIIGIIAILLGLFNLKDFFFYGKGFLMEVPLSWRPKMKAIIRGVTSPLGAFAIGFLISLFLLPCTGGPYIVILGLLGAKETFWNAVQYLLLYNIVFVLPMIAITIAVYKGFSTEKAETIRQKRLRVLHLIAGAILVVMGIVILVMY